MGWTSRKVLELSAVASSLSVSPPEEHHERRTFCRHGGNPRSCDSGSAIDSARGICRQFQEALWKLPKVCCEGWRLFWRSMNLICLYLLFCLFSDNIRRTFKHTLYNKCLDTPCIISVYNLRDSEYYVSAIFGLFVAVKRCVVLSCLNETLPYVRTDVSEKNILPSIPWLNVI